MLHEVGLLSAADLAAIRDGLEALPRSTPRGSGGSRSRTRTSIPRSRRRLTRRSGRGRRARPSRPLAQRSGARRAAPLSAGRRRRPRRRRPRGGRARSTRWRAREAETVLPGYTHLQQAMPSSVPLWAGGFAAELRDDALGIEACSRRIEKNPLGSAAGYGVPLLPIDREATRRSLGFAEIHEPVTAVQLSRGKAEAQVLFEIALLMQDLGRLAADLVLFATAEFAFVSLPAAMTTGSSIMPQKRNPDVFELVRGRSATAPGVPARGARRPRQAALRLSPRSPAPQGPAVPGDRPGGGDARDPRRRPPRGPVPPRAHPPGSRPPRRRGGLPRWCWSEGIPFREAYRRVGKRFRKSES